MHDFIFSLMTLVADQTLEAAKELPPITGIPFIDGVVRAGSLGVIAVLMWVIRILYGELKAKDVEIKLLRDKNDDEKQELNDKLIANGKETTTAILGVTEQQKKLVAAVTGLAQEDS